MYHKNETNSICEYSSNIATALNDYHKITCASSYHCEFVIITHYLLFFYGTIEIRLIICYTKIVRSNTRPTANIHFDFPKVYMNQYYISFSEKCDVW